MLLSVKWQSGFDLKFTFQRFWICFRNSVGIKSYTSKPNLFLPLHTIVKLKVITYDQTTNKKDRTKDKCERREQLSGHTSIKSLADFFSTNLLLLI